MLAAVVCVWAASCAPPQPDRGGPAPQPSVRASDEGGLVDGEGASEGAEPEVALVDEGGLVDGEGASEGAEPEVALADDGEVVDGQGALEGAQPDGGTVDSQGVSEGAQPPDGASNGGAMVDEEGVSEGADGSGGSGGFRQPGELVGHPRKPAAVVGEGAGPLRSEHSPWEAVMGEVFDVCDDGAAAAIIDRVLGSGADLTVEASYEITDEIAEIRLRCPPSGEPRYVHLGWRGPAEILRRSREEAREVVQGAACLYGCGHHLGWGNDQLGYETFPGVFAVDAPADEVVVLWDSVVLKDGELLGLVQNRSAALFAREVAVTWGEHSWVFPLTVQPGEVAPFVLDAGTVSALPEPSEIVVSAAMSPQPDLSRSFRNTRFPFHPADTSPWDAPWVSRFLADPTNALNQAAMDLPLGPGDRLREWGTEWELEQPTSHRGVAAVEDLVIEDVRAYLTFFNENTRQVIAVHPLTPFNRYAHPDEPLSGLPIIGSDGRRHYDFDLDFVWLADSEYDTVEVQTVMHVGGAGPWMRTGAAAP